MVRVINLDGETVMCDGVGDIVISFNGSKEMHGFREFMKLNEACIYLAKDLFYTAKWTKYSNSEAEIIIDNVKHHLNIISPTQYSIKTEVMPFYKALQWLKNTVSEPETFFLLCFGAVAILSTVVKNQK